SSLRRGSLKLWYQSRRFRPVGSKDLTYIASPDSRRDSRGVPYRFWTIGFWWKSSTGHYSYLA
nr:hypothetical protein [Tanacetum cinerariifolium]